MDISQYCFNQPGSFRSGSVKPGDKAGFKNKQQGLNHLAKNREEMQLLQGKLYAEGQQALLVVLQAMDAAGKDGTINKVFSGISPEGIRVANFKQPSKQELAHDYLWRIHREVPERGVVGVFNRSHYEEVLVARVEDLPKNQNLPTQALRKTWANRYRQISEFEQYLYENGVWVVKIYLYLSKEEQRERLLARLDNPDKNWKFEGGDLDTRAKWDAYAKAYREAINKTAAPHAPWYVVPADRKWVSHAVVSEIVVQTLKAMKPRFPSGASEQELAGYRERLINE